MIHIKPDSVRISNIVKDSAIYVMTKVETVADMTLTLF